MRTVAAFGVCIALARVVVAQAPASGVGFVDVGSERDRVLRVLQLTGDVPLYPWTMRALSPGETDRLMPTTARGRSLLPAEPRTRTMGPLRLQVLPLDVQAIYNSAFPYGYNDGPIWAGRGVTGAVSAGLAGRVGPLSFQLEPMVFDAQNAAFPLKPTGVPNEPYWDGFYPGAIDLPQRFGSRAYGRFDLGQSAARLDVGPVMAEVSTSDQWWGPAIENPLILGNNAPGFPHLSLGTSHPIDIGIGSVHGRVVWGQLGQSAYSPDTAADSVRFMAGLVGSFSPRGVPGLELGVTRFFHRQWPAGGFFHGSFSTPFEGILKSSLATTDNPTGENPDNQLASLFARWTFPAARVEIYGEYGREDHNKDLRDLWEEPDHDAAYTLGIQRAWKFSGDRVLAVRAELLNARISALYQGRSQAPWYVHGSTVEQGHTVDGQFLAAPAAYGGAGGSLAFDLYDVQGRWTVAWTRAARAANAPNQNVDLRSDVLHAISVERWRKIDQTDVFLAFTGVLDLNRDFVSDRANANVRAGARLAFR